MSEYASSSILVVFRVDAHHIRRATLTSATLRRNVSTSASMPVISSNREARLAFVPIIVQSCDRNMRFRGAMSSCSVHPRENHLLVRNAESRRCRLPEAGTS